MVKQLRGALIAGAVGYLILVSPVFAESFFDEWRYPDESDDIGDWELHREQG